ncbi:2Fe-2S iron-sulfur cluster-binding protein [Limnobacter litoralis]|uniref:2Fe-2S iron-sulfur cluster-binding protein n=1 Tax=Limnobacter litoralis TaxID=481366 RepID=UPI0024E10CFC|nr:2Fe-2S iron-sulfur cluster-binding protein [Limnobacter litoralis]
MATITLSSGRSFETTSEKSILDAAAQANVALPYSCRTGRCSTCRCKVISGLTTALNPETGLTELERAEGWILSCTRAAETDLVLDVDDLGGLILPTPKTLPCRINEIVHLAPDVIQVFLRLPPTADFEFTPGQYVDVIGPNGIHRSYSLANGSFADKVLELHIRSVDGGEFSEYWFKQAKPNDLLRIHGPLGTFFLRNTANIDLVFLATGTGIAPVKSILESLPRLKQDENPKSITVLWGGRKPADLYFDVSQIPGNFTFIPVLSRPDRSWKGQAGYVHDVLLKTIPNLQNAAVYACGSTAMIHSAKAKLTQASLPSSRFYSDAFVSSGTT